MDSPDRIQPSQTPWHTARPSQLQAPIPDTVQPSTRTTSSTAPIYKGVDEGYWPSCVSRHTEGHDTTEFAQTEVLGDRDALAELEEGTQDVLSVSNHKTQRPYHLETQ
ncbi:unnamed protein product [Cyclocybe aegerita]|uniref:Uncharacterized protein n=1 Tax=Cyclocybe aegerita TaxID=1973307 RepID=A0A8S0XYR1_CYCAE|nr:unnamed protein product [Cyclocybe aegerita]CAA7270939.1 unnamed protein product [Cyclocybe aegerita]